MTLKLILYQTGHNIQDLKKCKTASTRYIWWDTEASQEPDNDNSNKQIKLNIHKPNLIVIIEAIITSKCYSKEEINYMVNHHEPIIFDGYDCINGFMDYILM